MVATYFCRCVWELNLRNASVAEAQQLQDAFDKESIDDILLVISYEGDTPRGRRKRQRCDAKNAIVRAFDCVAAFVFAASVPTNPCPAPTYSCKSADTPSLLSSCAIGIAFASNGTSESPVRVAASILP